MPNLPTEVIDSPCVPCGQAGEIFMISADLLPPPRPPEPPPVGSDASEYERYFAKLQGRTDKLREQHDAAVQAELDARADQLGKDWGEIGKIAGAFYKYYLKIGFALAKWFYAKPDWNDPKWVDAAITTSRQCLALGFQPFGPFVGPDRASSEDAIDWAGVLEEAYQRLQMLAIVYPEKALDMASCFDWIAANERRDSRIVDLRQSGLYPPELARGSQGLTDQGLAAFARAVAMAKGRDSGRVIEAAFAAQRDLLSRDLDLRDPTGEPYRYSGNRYMLAETIRRTMDAADAAPPEPFFLLTMVPDGGSGSWDTSGSAMSSLFGDDAPRLGTGATAGNASGSDAGTSSGGNAGILLALVAAYAVFQLAFAPKAKR